MTDRAERTTLAAGGLAAILASTCCLGPLLLVSIGVSGSWIGNLSKLEPYRPLTLGAALVALGLAYRRIWRSTAVCAPGDVCAIPAVRRSYKILFWLVAALTIVGIAFPFIAPIFY